MQHFIEKLVKCIEILKTVAIISTKKFYKNLMIFLDFLLLRRKFN